MYYITYEDEKLFQSFRPCAYFKVAQRTVKRLSEKLKLPIENFKIIEYPTKNIKIRGKYGR